ncbi:hypothetical protein N7E81_07275 [Reichenbachiella carrageenanivorans]|uniref:Uncharacterized protein n=1 Tax=Reichenbachiella carrageenanivorans TaxID=2979869 RepID=A0ABY6D521_9BACT|nr:hypothetical protein [Reichenbachiella carrageenanivorans]UXX80899.1 hypothetical protein N7E81_07275 [Reichenbachiella carrageenanivorans]
MITNDPPKIQYKFKGGKNHPKEVRESKQEIIDMAKQRIVFEEYYKSLKPENESHVKHCNWSIEQLNNKIKDEQQIENSIIDNSRVPFYIYITYKEGKSKTMSSWCKRSNLKLLENPKHIEESPDGQEEMRAISDMIRIETQDYKNDLPDFKLSRILRFYRYTPSQAIAYNAMLFLQRWWSPKLATLSHFDKTYEPFKKLNDLVDLGDLFPSSRMIFEDKEPKKTPTRKYKYLFKQVENGQIEFDEFAKQASVEGENFKSAKIRYKKRTNFLADPLNYFNLAHLLFNDMDIENDNSDAIFIMESLNTFYAFMRLVEHYARSLELSLYQNTLWYFHTTENFITKLMIHIDDSIKKNPDLRDEHDLLTFLRPPGDIQHSQFQRYIENKSKVSQISDS